MPKSSKTWLILLANLIALGLCIASSFVLLGSGLTVWLTQDEEVAEAGGQAARRRLNRVALPTPTASPTPTITASPTPSATPTVTPQPTETATAVPTATPSPPPTDTPVPPTVTPTPPPAPTATATPTATPAPPSYPFEITERGGFETNHPNFDVYIAVVNDDNKPLSDYRVIGAHSSGLRVESQLSAGDWTQNSGAMHYKAGNIKYEVPNSPSGVWSLQLVNAEGAPVAPPVEVAFEAASPTWYYLIFERD